MNEHEKTFHHTVAHRKGFALILTLSALAAIIALTSVLVSYMDVARKEASMSKALIQANLYYSDINKIFKGFKDRKTLYAVLYLTPLPLASEDGRFSLIVSCKPMANRVNINWLGQADDVNMSKQVAAAQKVFDSVNQAYELEDASMLETMVLEAIGSKKKYVLQKESRLRQKNGIISFKQFSAILDKYQRESDDSQLGKIPWRTFFMFRESSSDPDENLIDGDNASAELLSALLDVEVETLKESWIPGTMPLKDFAREQGITYDKKLFAQEFVPLSSCEVQYDYEGERFSFGFEDIEGEIRNFEFFGKQ